MHKGDRLVCTRPHMGVEVGDIASIEAALTSFAAEAGNDRDLWRGVRAVRRSADALGRRVNGS